MSEHIPLIISVQKLSSQFAAVERYHYRWDTDSRETDTEHSYSVTMLAWMLCSTLDLPLDMGKVLKYSLIHDLPEAYASDVNTFASDQERQRKIEAEREALGRLAIEFEGFDDMLQALTTYEAKDDEEALFVWTVDKMQALILGQLDDWRPFREYGVSYDEFRAKHKQQIEAGSPYCNELYSELLEHCSQSYYDNPDRIQ